MSKQNRAKTEKKTKQVLSPRWLIDVLLGAVLYLLLGYLTPTPSERVYLAWPVVFLFDALFLGAGWRSPLVLTVVTVGAGGTVMDVWGRPAFVMPGEYARVGWCVAGWVAALGITRALFNTLWARCTPQPNGRLLHTTHYIMWIIMLALLIMPISMSYLQVHPIRWHGDFDPGTMTPALVYDDVAFRSADGTRLQGWFIPATGSERSVVLVHGVMDHKGGMRHFVEPLHDAGFNILMFDLRGHGRSAGWTVTYGEREKDDVMAAVDYLETMHPEASRQVVGVAWSMGAAAMILAAAEDPRIAAIHVDAPYAATADMALHIGEPMHDWLAWWLYWTGTALASLEADANLFSLSPAEAAAEISPRPVLIVHGTMDRVVPVAQGRKVFNSCLPPRTLVEVPGAGHLETLFIEGPAYEQRLVEFLNDALRK